MTRLNFFFLFPSSFIIFMYPATLFPLFIMFGFTVLGHFCVAYSNTSFEFESRIRAAVNNM